MNFLSRLTTFLLTPLTKPTTTTNSATPKNVANITPKITDERFSKRVVDKRRLLLVFTSVLLTVLVVIFIFSKSIAIKACIEAMVVFGTTVMPVIIPFSTLLVLLNYNLDKEFNGKNNFIFKALKGLFLITAGYPTGAKTALYLHDNGANITTCKRLVFITSIASPLVIINCVGRLTFKSAIFGVIMFLAQLLSAKITVDICFSCDKNSLDFLPNKCNILGALIENIKAILLSAMLTLTCYSTVKIAVDILLKSAVNYPLLVGTIAGLIETNYGMKWFSLVISPLSISLANFILTFGGAPVIFQTAIICKQLKMRTAKVLKIKLLQSAICFILTYLFMIIFFFLAL